MTNDNMTPESSRGPLRRLLIVLLIVVGVAIYAYGWNATDISLDEVQDPVRQASVSRALRELLSPDLFARDRTQQHYATPFTVGCSEGESAGARRDDLEDDAYIIITPGCADQDEIVNIEGYHLPANAIAGVYIRRDNGQTLPFKLVRADGTVSEESTFDVDNSGYFNIQVKVPRGRGISNQTLPLEVQTISPTGWPRLSQTTNTVIEKMVETIFLALMATTLAVPISIAISFLAARNLMRQVHLPLGNVLVGVVLLPVGAALGYLLVGPLGRVAVNWGKDLWLGLISPVVMVAPFGAVAHMSDRLQLNGTGNRIRSLLMNLLLFMAIIFVLGALGGLLVWLGGQFTGNVTRYFGNFVGTIGELIDLTIEWFAALGGAVIVASVGATWSAVALRAVRAPLSNVLGGVLGALSGAILLGSTAFIGTQAVLLGLLTAIVAAVLGGQATVLAYERLFRRPSVALRRRRREDVSAEQAARSTLFIIGAILTFLVAAYVLDLLRAIVDERPPSARMMDLGLFQIRVYIAQAALMGAVLGGLAGGLAGAHTSFPLGMAVYNTTRTILNALRSIEPLIMGIVFVIWVGVGPFAGVLALTLHSIAALGKLYSEQVENIDAGPIEAIQSTGANRLQTIVYAVWPQIVPPYIAFTMYRWDINVRMSTIIGFVGGGGIGFLLQQQINLLRYNQAGVAVLAIAIVVSVLDYASAAIRERLV